MQVWKVRLPDGRTVRPGEWSSTPLYSTVEIAAGAGANLRAFGYGKGGTVPGSVGPRSNASLADTNFRGDGGELQENEELLLYTIQVELFVIPDNLANFWAGAEIGTPDPPEVSLWNVLRFQCDTMLKLEIAETKDYFDHPISFWPAAMGVRHYTSAARPQDAAAQNQRAIVGGHHGSPASYDNRRIATPHTIKGGEQFGMLLYFPQGSVRNLDLGSDNNARLRVRLYGGGYRKRPVA